ncbi:MAG: archaeosortase/exosortase family protein [Methanobacteriota archaeon]
MNKKLFLWLALTLIFLSLFFKSLWQNIGNLLSPVYIQEKGVYPWAVLLLCTFWIYIKREEISKKMQAKRIFIFIGSAAILTSVAIQFEELPFLVFAFLLCSLGFFFIFFGEAGIIPALLLGVYGFTIAFPVIFSKFFETHYALATVKIVTTILNVLGYPINAEGQIISFLDVSGKSISAFVGAPSSGIASITIFVAIFVLMMLDVTLPARKALYMFLFGLVGTCFQNILRLIILILTGYYYGSAALWKAHDYAGYIIFPAWFAVFVFIYLHVSK